MAPIVIPSTLQVHFVWNLSGVEVAKNTMNAIIGPGPIVDQTLANTIAGLAGAAHVSSNLPGLQPTTITLAQVRIRDVRTANNPEISATVNSAGTDTAKLLPRGLGLVVTHRTAKAGASYRGRSFVPGFSDTATNADGRATTTAMAAAEELLTDFNAAMTTNGWPMGVASQTLKISTPITLYEVRNSTWDRQWGRALRGTVA